MNNRAWERVIYSKNNELFFGNFDLFLTEKREPVIYFTEVSIYEKTTTDRSEAPLRNVSWGRQAIRNFISNVLSKNLHQQKSPVLFRKTGLLNS